MERRVLVVDDEENIVFALRRFLKRHGFEVDGARELEEAQALLVNYRYAALIADLRLTGVHGAEGLDVVSYAREHSPWTKTILLTAYGSAALEAEAHSRGVDVVLRKPKPLQELAVVLNALVGDTDEAARG